jgi:glutathione synthase/RimK-type ligase-like ATP-grasp enzyme
MRGRGGRTPLMRKVAYMTGRSYRGMAMAGVPPIEQPGSRMVIEAGAKHGLAFEVAYWDDPTLPERFDAALIRSCWDYHERAEQFVETLEAHQRAGLPVFNSPDIVRWNSRKTYLKDLGAAAIPTVWTERADATAVRDAFETLGADEIVVKPQVGAGSIATVRLNRETWSEANLADGPKGAAMIQPFLKAIATEGERSLFWFGGAFSHAIRKVPQAGDWLANIPGKTAFVQDKPPHAAIDTAEAARARIPHEVLYVRIDLVLGDDGAWRVIEIEAIEPYLFLDFAPDGAAFFAKAVAGVLNG